MRPIRFRCWDKFEKRMFSKALDVTSDEISYEFPKGLIGQINGWEWMQFTGLLDKNGAEIYEGDIIQCENCPKSLEVRFADGRFYLFPDHWNFEEIGEVIGNIHENPELLK